jgi:hypothetical protein
MAAIVAGEHGDLDVLDQGLDFLEVGVVCGFGHAAGLSCCVDRKTPSDDVVSQKRGKARMFFFEKKNQKTFTSLQLNGLWMFCA